MATKEVATQAKAGVPALASTPALELDQTDVALPRIKIGQLMSQAVIDDLVPKGGFYSAVGSEDGDPEVLYKTGEGDGLLIHVLAVRKGKSLTVDGELETFAFDDPNAPAEAWVTYDYVVCLPEVDPGVPYKMLLTRTGASTAKQINFALVKNEARGPSYLLAFRLTTAKRENDKGTFWVPRAKQVDPSDEHVQAASNLAEMIAGSLDAPASSNVSGNEPAI